MSSKRQNVCVAQTYWTVPSAYRGLLDVATETFEDFYALVKLWIDNRRNKIGQHPLSVESEWAGGKIVLKIVDHRHESERQAPTRKAYGPEVNRIAIAEVMTRLVNSVQRYNRDYVSVPTVKSQEGYMRDARSPGDWTKWRYTVSACMFKVAEGDYFSMLRCYPENWSKGHDVPSIELCFDTKDGEFNRERTANSIVNVCRIHDWSDEIVVPWTDWLAKQVKIHKRALKKPLNTTGLGEFETLRVNGFYRPESKTLKRTWGTYADVKLPDQKKWQKVDTHTVSDPGQNVGVLFECGNRLVLFVEHEQIWVLARFLRREYWQAGRSDDAENWSKIDPEDTWAEHRIAKAIAVFFDKG